MASADIEFRCFVGGIACATDNDALERRSSNRRSIINDRETGFVTFSNIKGSSLGGGGYGGHREGGGGGGGGLREVRGGDTAVVVVAMETVVEVVAGTVNLEIMTKR
ncbi:hypothetical protein RchiOBHm_Chr5g0042331 [Rosa chinensis]|uniref:Uncharacterized protein n=1 Tax=Rosa chinensis TaxID=74649 RepID=A0A2P6QD37_ROSCH|nr:hypothetical protein RchiOBHm_Chr5g0042331 [Rosa chinensis]